VGAAAAVGKAMSAVSDIGGFVRPPGMPPGAFVSGTAITQAAFDQNALKLATAIKNLCDGMQLLEEKQNVSIAQLQELYQSIEHKTMVLQGDQKQVKAAMAAAKKAIRTSQNLVGQDILPTRHEERLQLLESQVASLLKWQESWFVESVTRRPSPSAKADAKPPMDSEECKELRSKVQALERDAEQSKELQSKVQTLERKSECIRQLCETINSIGERGDLISSEVKELKRHIASKGTEFPLASHLESCISSDEVTQSLESLNTINRMLEKNIVDLSGRLDLMQVDQKRQSLQLGSCRPTEVAQKLDQLWEECKSHFSKVKEHDIHLSFFLSSFENHKQQCLGIDDSFSLTLDARGHSQDLSDVPAAETSSIPMSAQQEVGQPL
jgi:microcompartment protein CcmL/EutN